MLSCLASPCSEEPGLRDLGEEFHGNEDSLLAELQQATSGANVPGVDQIIQENERLSIEKCVVYVVGVHVCMCVCICYCAHMYVCMCLEFRVS